MQRRRGLISRGERARAANGLVDSRRGRTSGRVLPDASASSNSGRGSGGERRPVKRGLAAFTRLLGRPPVVRDDGEPAVARGDVAHARHLRDRLAREAGEAAAGRRHARRREQHPGQPDVAGEAHAAVGLRRPVEPSRAAGRSSASRPTGEAAGRLGGERSAASSASSPKLKVRAPLMTKPSAVSHSARVDVPAAGGRRRRASRARPPPPRATAARTRAPRSTRR